MIDPFTDTAVAIVRADEGPMQRDEARKACEQVKASMEKTHNLLLQLHNRRGWHALGYPDWETFVREELEISARRANQLLAAQKARENIGQDAREASEKQLRPLAGLQPEQQKEIWEQATKEEDHSSAKLADLAAAARSALGGEGEKVLADLKAKAERRKMIRVEKLLRKADELIMDLGGCDEIRESLVGLINRWTELLEE